MLAGYLRLLFAISRDWPASHSAMIVPEKYRQCRHGGTYWLLVIPDLY